MADLVERIARAILLHEEACDVDAILATTEHAGDCPFAADPKPYTCARCQAVGARGQARLILKTLAEAGLVIVPREPTEAMQFAYQGALAAYIEATPPAERKWRKRRVGGYKIQPQEKARARWHAMIAAAEAENRDA